MVGFDVILGCFGQKFRPFLFLAQNLVQLFLSFVVISKICTLKKVHFLRLFLGDKFLVLFVDFDSLLPDITV